MTESDNNNGQVKTFTPRTRFKLKVGWPSIFPENALEPFTFEMRTQLVGDAEKLQAEFLGLPEAERDPDRRHQYDVAMMAQLSMAAPTGFPDFPALVDHEGEVAAAIQEYFYPPDPERKEGMRFICRGVMAQYWNVVTPADYL